MADNTTLNSGSGGDTISTDDVGGGVKVQRVKIQTGADGNATDISSANPLPVSDNGSSFTVDDGGSSLTIDGSVAISGTPTVAITSIAAGTTNIGDVDVLTLPALPAGTNNIGDVDVLTLPALPTGTNQIGQVEAVGDVASDSPIVANPVTIGARAGVSPPTPVSTDGDAVNLRATRAGELMVMLTDSAGDSVMDDTNNAVRVNLVAGASAGGTSLADDAAFTVGTTSATPVAGIYRSSRDNVDDGDAGALAMTQNRGLITVPQTANGDALYDDTADTLKVSGSVAHDAANAANVSPLLIGARAANSVLTAVSADGDAVMARADRFGQLFTRMADAAGDSCMDETNNSLQVTVVAGSVGGSGGTSMADDAAFTVGTTSVTPVAGTYRTSRDSLDDNDGGAIAITQKRAVLSCIETPAGDSAMDETNDAVKVSIVASTPTLVTNNGATDTSGSIANNGEIVQGASGAWGSIGVELSGTWVGTIAFEARGVAAAAWVPILAFPPGSSTGVTSATANGVWQLQHSGLSQVRLRATAWTSGTATVTTEASAVDFSPPPAAGAAGGTSMVDDAAFTPGSTSITPMGGTYRTSRDTLDDNDGGTIALTQSRGQFVTLETSAGGAIGSTGGALDVNIANQAITINVAATSVVPGNGATALGKAEDAAAANGDTGVAVLAVRRDSATSGVGADGDYAMISVDSTGALRVTGGGGGSQFAEDAVAGSGDLGTLALAVRRDAAASSSGTDGDYSTLNVNATGRLYTSTTIDAALPAGTANIGDVDVLTMPGTVTEDAASAGGETLVAVAAVRRDTAASSSGTDGDFSTLNVNATGRLYTSATVDAALPAGTNNIGDVDVLTLVPGTGATALGKAEDAVAGSGDTGVAMLAVRRDTPGTGIGADGDYAFLEVDSNGSLRVNVTNGGDGSVQGVDAHDAALSAAPLTIGGYASAAAPTSVSADGDAVRAWVLRNGAQATVLTAAGALIGGDAANGIDVDVTRVTGTVTVDTELPTAAALADNAANPTTVLVGSCVMGFDGTTWDRVTNGNGTAATALRVTLASDSTGIVASTATGAAAHDAAVSGNPVLIGCEARTSDGTAVTNGDVVRPMASTLGKQVVHVGSIPALQIQGNLNETNNTASDVIAAQASGVKIAIMSYTVTNKDATNDADVTLRDGTTAKIGPLYAKAAGGGFTLTGGGYPLFIGTAATAVTFLSSAATCNLLVSVSGYLTTE